MGFSLLGVLTDNGGLGLEINLLLANLAVDVRLPSFDPDLLAIDDPTDPVLQAANVHKLQTARALAGRYELLTCLRAVLGPQADPTLDLLMDLDLLFCYGLRL